MCQREARGAAVIALLATIAAISSVALAQSPPQQRLPPDYVKGILSLKSSLLANKQSNSGIRFGMRYTPQLENKQHLESPQQEIQVEHVANLRHCPPAHRSLVHSQMPQVKLNRYSQEFPAPHLFQPPFVPLSTRQESPQLEAQDSLDSPPTAEQLELLQQLSDFFGQRQQLQQQVQQQGQSAGCAPDKSVGKELCDAEPPADGCETTREPDKTEEEDSVSVDVKNKPAEETTTTQPKPTVNPKTKTTKPSIAKSTTHKPRTTRTTKSTTKKLPCCTKPLKQSLAKAPNIISFSLNIENDETEESKSLHQQHRSGRHVIQPDLRINAITNLLRYRRKRAQGAAPFPMPFSQLKDQKLDSQSRQKRRKDKILDRKQLLQAELKIWPISIRSS
ncbi:uncharacterized protein LOC128258121 isoform X1 [Drosophila gunungcola]|uniref:uncharacterized protein LOC128258121 isoform X1 n=1 Tax=Drosophila gunungcola TaxID=103775 RepID=UPI0022E7A0B7|nr:uncharacterized protein LOC128258121 isoform X1 [Drosophila gunungcola]